jgi:hypothetical protein
MSRYPEYDGLDTSDEVLDALFDIAADEGIEFMQLWEDGCTETLSNDDVISKVQLYILCNVDPDDLADEYYWGRDNIIHICTDAKHEFKIVGFEAIKRIVRSGSQTSSRINLPPDWQGKKVMVIRLE